jgi:NAD(P)-dependent dehydrogenase (short-subunit alcohol dehydrogenase family)
LAKSTNASPMANRLIIVTGASSGVGYATVRRLVYYEGATVIAIGRRRMFRIEALANQVPPGKLTSITADMANRDQANAVIGQIIQKHGKVDAFVHGVNRLLRLTALEVTDNEFDLTLQVNVKSALYSVQALAPHFRQVRQGSIVIYNPTPLETEDFAAAEAVYCAAANALSALSAGWCRQLDPFGISVSEIAPSPTTEHNAADAPAHDKLIADALRESFCIPQYNEAAVVNAPEISNDEPKVLSERGGLRLTAY